MNAIQRLLDRWRHPGETVEQRGMRLYLADLSTRPTPRFHSSAQSTRLVHALCGTDHLIFEACPAAPPRMGVGRMTIETKGGEK